MASRLDRQRRRLLAAAAAALGGPLPGAVRAAPVAPEAAAASASPAASPAFAAATASAAGASAPVGPDDADKPLLGVWTHAYAAFGRPKYPADYDHFEYADPAAVKGGTLYLKNPDRRTSFDKFNPYTLRGQSPGGIAIFMIESLTIPSGDEPQTMYGLLAEAMWVAPDKSSITFRLHPRARFADGDPVTAADVKHSFDTQSSKLASPTAQGALASVAAAVVLDPRTVRFDLRERTTDALFAIGGLGVYSRRWGRGADGRPKPFDQIVAEYPIASGPYRIARVDSGRRIEFARNPDYWARDLPVRRGFYNFDRVVYRYYRDNDVAREAFKAGEFDILKEYSARAWVRQHKGPKWASGQIVKDPFPTAYGQGQQAFDLNLRRPKFRDIRVRAAIDLTYDFKMAVNRYGEYTRGDSLFSNTGFAAQGPPSADELKLLEPFRQDLPPEVFGPAFVAPRTDGEPARLRANLLRARELFRAAGWNLAPDGRLRNAAGEAFTIEYLRPGEGGGSMPEWQLDLEKLGARLILRDVDFTLYQRRLEVFDFDMIAIVEGTFTLPDVASLVQLYGSKGADEPGSNNFRGVRSAAVDSLLAAMGAAPTLAALRAAARALDRVVMWNRWQVPGYYTANERASYWNKFRMPKTRPLYYTIESPSDNAPRWPIMTWWLKNPAA